MAARPDKRSSTNPILNPSSPYFLYPTDTGLKIVTNIFSGNSLKSWKRSVTIAFSGKNKLCFINGSIKRSTGNDKLGKVWDRVNDIVIGWILNALDERLAQSVIYHGMAKAVWEDLEHRYGETSGAQLFTVLEQLRKATN